MLVPIGRPPFLPPGVGGRRDSRGLGVSSGKHWLKPFSWILGKGANATPAPIPELGEGWLSNQDPGVLEDCGEPAPRRVQCIYPIGRPQVCLFLCVKNHMGSPIAGPTHLLAQEGT